MSGPGGQSMMGLVMTGGANTTPSLMVPGQSGFINQSNLQQGNMPPGMVPGLTNHQVTMVTSN